MLPVDTSQLSSGLTSIANSLKRSSLLPKADRANALASVQGTAAYQAMTADQQAEINAATSSSPGSSENGGSRDLDYGPNDPR